MLSVSPESFQLSPGAVDEFSVLLTNVSFERVMWRIMSTAPDTFVVKPSKGVIEPSMTEPVCVALAKGAIVGSSASAQFQLEFCAVEEGDRIDARGSNVSALIKSRKPEKKRLTCRIVPRPQPAADSGAATAAAAAAPPSAPPPTVPVVASAPPRKGGNSVEVVPLTTLVLSVIVAVLATALAFMMMA